MTVVTGPTVILPLLRQARLKSRPASYLKWEGIANDPVGAVLVVVIFDYFAGSGPQSIGETLLRLVTGVGGAVVSGGAAAWLLGRGFIAGQVAEYLKGPVALAVALGTYALSNAEELLPLVFTLILATIVLHGFSLGWVARRLDLSAERGGGLIIAGATAWGNGLARTLHERGVPIIVADNVWHRLRGARLHGVPVYFGELVSEHAEHSLELGAFGNLLAVTDNDSYNALACAHFAPELGRQKVYQLATGGVPEARRPAPGARGRIAFSDEVQHEDLQRHWYQGWGFDSSRITNRYDVDDFQAQLPEGAVPMLVIGVKKGVRILEAGRSLKAEPNEQVLWLGCKDICRPEPNDDPSALQPTPLA